LPDSTLIIGVATSTAERVQLARLLDGADALLLVASAEQAAAFLERAGSSARPQIVLPPGSIPGGVGGPAVEGAVADGPAVDGAATDHPAVEAAGRDRADGDGVEHGSAVGGAGGAPGRLASLAHSGLPAGLSLDVHRRVVRWKDKEVMLTRLEHDFLRCLATEPGRVWTYQRLHLTVWGNEHLGHGSHIHSVVKRLRRKLARLGTTVTIHAVRGVGFHLPTSR
jgi:Transcriptional regulatory protein, C terminal